jgi:hypothetical protein
METIEETLRDQEARELADKLVDLYLYMNRDANEEDGEMKNTYDVSFVVADKLKFKAHVEFEVGYINGG